MRKSNARVEMDFQRIGTQDEFSEVSNFSQPSLDNYYSKRKKRKVVDFDTVSNDSHLTI